MCVLQKGNSMKIFKYIMLISVGLALTSVSYYSTADTRTMFNSSSVTDSGQCSGTCKKVGSEWTQSCPTVSNGTCSCSNMSCKFENGKRICEGTCKGTTQSKPKTKASVSAASVAK